MPRNIPDPLLVTLNAEVASVAQCWRITRRDGTVFAYTSLDVPVTFESVTFRPLAGATSSAVESGSGLSVDNLDVAGVLTDDAITDEDLRAGKFDAAVVEIFLIDYAAPDKGRALLLAGRLGTITLLDTQWQCEVRSLSQLTQNLVTDIYAPTCGAEFGDERCGVDLSVWTRSGEVVSVRNRRSFVGEFDLADGYANYGRLTWTSGILTGRSCGIVSAAAGMLTLDRTMTADIGVGDTFEITAGCDRLLTTCRDRYANMANFRGCPFLPGETIYLYPDAAD